MLRQEPTHYYVSLCNFMIVTSLNIIIGTSGMQKMKRLSLKSKGGVLKVQNSSIIQR